MMMSRWSKRRGVLVALGALLGVAAAAVALGADALRHEWVETGRTYRVPNGWRVLP